MQEGVFTAQAMSIDFGFTSNGTEQAAITFELLDTHETITAYLYFSEKAAERSIKTLRMMGWTGDDVGNIQVGEIQNEVDLVLEESEYDGKVSLKVKWINARGGAALKDKMDDSQRASFSERMRGLAIASAPKAGSSKPAARAPARTAQPARRSPPQREPDPDFPIDDDMPNF